MRQSLIDLLEKHEIEGYPTEYLISRIKGRRTTFITDWDGLIISHSPVEYLQGTRYKESINEYSRDGIWYLLWSEYRWLYRQMNKRLRRDFLYLFLYPELKRLIRCLRYKQLDNKGNVIHSLLRFSLMSKDIKKMLISDDLLMIIDWLDGKGRCGFKKAFSENGIMGLEERLMDWFFDEISSVKPHHLVKEVFSYIIDSTNLISLFKYYEWQSETPPPFINGGSLSREGLLRIWDEKRIDHMIQVVRGLTNISINRITHSDIEVAMRNGLIKIAKRMRREGSDTGIILNYIIMLNNEVENLGLILYGERLEREVISKELAYLKG